MYLKYVYFNVINKYFIKHNEASFSLFTAFINMGEIINKMDIQFLKEL